MPVRLEAARSLALSDQPDAAAARQDILNDLKLPGTLRATMLVALRPQEEEEHQPQPGPLLGAFGVVRYPPSQSLHALLVGQQTTTHMQAYNDILTEVLTAT